MHYADLSSFSNFSILGDSVWGVSACVGACPRAVAGGRPGDGRQHALGGTNSVLCSVELLLVVLVAHS